MEIDKWIGLYKVRAIPWIDGKRIYFNVQYYNAGQSICQPPVWDKTVYITGNNAGENAAFRFTHSLVEYIANIQLKDNTEITLTFYTQEGKSSGSQNTKGI